MDLLKFICSFKLVSQKNANKLLESEKNEIAGDGADPEAFEGARQERGLRGAADARHAMAPVGRSPTDPNAEEVLWGIWKPGAERDACRSWRFRKKNGELRKYWKILEFREFVRRLMFVCFVE